MSFISYFSCNLVVTIDQTKRRLKFKVTEYRRNVNNQKIPTFSDAALNHYFDVSTPTISPFFSSSHLDSHETFYALKNSKNLIIDFFPLCLLFLMIANWLYKFFLFFFFQLLTLFPLFLIFSLFYLLHCCYLLFYFILFFCSIILI